MTPPIADDAAAFSVFQPAAVISTDCTGYGLKVAGLSVLERLVINLSRAGVRRIVLVGQGEETLIRSKAMGIQVERVELLPPLQGQVLVTQANVVAGVGDLEGLIRCSGRLVTRDAERLPVGVVENPEANWRSWLNRAPEVVARGPAGCVTDGGSAGRIQRAYWASLTSKSDGVVDRWFNRPVGRWLSLALVDTRVTPNQVSMAAILVGLGSAILLTAGSWGLTVAGALMLQLSAIVDCVDGDLARAQCRESALGKWLDIVGDQVVHLGVFIGVGIGLWRSGAGESVVILGCVAAGGVVLSFLVILRTLLHPELRGRSRLQRFIDATTNRDFSVVLILFALAGILDWFLWMAVVGAHLFWMVALALQIWDRETGSSDEQAA